MKNRYIILVQDLESKETFLVTTMRYALERIGLDYQKNRKLKLPVHVAVDGKVYLFQKFLVGGESVKWGARENENQNP